MEKPHGATQEAKDERISRMAERILMVPGITDEQLRDPTDINSEEDEEIAQARTLADQWLSEKP